MEIVIKKLKCLQCGHTWIPRTEDVRACPNCQSKFWDKKQGVKHG